MGLHVGIALLPIVCLFGPVRGRRTGFASETCELDQRDIPDCAVRPFVSIPREPRLVLARWFPVPEPRSLCASRSESVA